MKHLTALTLLLSLLFTAQPILAATCTGSASCRACKNCRYCKHCAKRGGTCGACVPSRRRPSLSRTQRASVADVEMDRLADKIIALREHAADRPITAHIVGVYKHSDGTILHLDNGQVWQMHIVSKDFTYPTRGSVFIAPEKGSYRVIIEGAEPDDVIVYALRLR
jgi:hypothetical protein